MKNSEKWFRIDVGMNVSTCVQVNVKCRFYRYIFCGNWLTDWHIMTLRKNVCDCSSCSTSSALKLRFIQKDVWDSVWKKSIHLKYSWEKINHLNFKRFVTFWNIYVFFLTHVILHVIMSTDIWQEIWSKLTEASIESSYSTLNFYIHDS